MPFLDDIYTACRPERLYEVHTTVDEQLATHAHIHVHHGKTQVWNRGGVEPGGIEGMLKLEAIVWPLLPADQQGWAFPLGEYVQEFLAHKMRQQQVLFQRIPWVNDTQSASLLLSMCGATRANFWLRAQKMTRMFGRASARSCHMLQRQRMSSPPCHCQLGRFPANGQKRNPRTARMMIRQLEVDDPVSSVPSTSVGRVW